MFASLPGALTVTVIRNTVTGIDDYGNDVVTPVNFDIPGCMLAPGATTELAPAGALADTTTQAAELYVPAGSDIGPLDQVLIGTDLYDVTGDPENWTSPFTTLQSPMRVNLRKVTGGTAGK